MHGLYLSYSLLFASFLVYFSSCSMHTAPPSSPPPVPNIQDASGNLIPPCPCLDGSDASLSLLLLLDLVQFGRIALCASTYSSSQARQVAREVCLKSAFFVPSHLLLLPCVVLFCFVHSLVLFHSPCIFCSMQPAATR